VNDHRWDWDDRGDGVADATALAPGVYELAAAVTIAKWVAEEPEVHLLPHIRDACAQASIRQRGNAFEVVTGLLASDTPFKRRGHMVRIELVPLD
jgi:hypothetical protein